LLYTVWSSTASFKEAIGQSDVISSTPVVFNFRQSSASVGQHINQEVGENVNVKPENWDEGAAI